MKAREGDLIEDLNRIIFDVKGLTHPPNRIIAFPRFFPYVKGERKRGKTRYSKVYALHERFAMLKQQFPQYLVFDKVFDELLCEVPVDAIKHYYNPVECLTKLRSSDKNVLGKAESRALQFASLLKESAKILWSKIGVSGSILVGLHKPKSDIDLIVYGTENCNKVYSVLQAFLEESNGVIRRYNREDLKVLFDFRSKDTKTTFEDFLRTERRKVLQGKFMGKDYFIRFVKDWNEIDEKYGDVQYVNAGYAKIKASIVNVNEAIFTPCIYRIDNVEILEGIHVQPIREIASFRGRFCEQARIDEKVVAQGKVEKVRKMNETEYYRILLGNKPTDFMILA